MATLCLSDPRVYMARVSRLSQHRDYNNEAWNAYFADAAVGKMPLYPSTAQLITNNYPPLFPSTSWV